MKKKVGLALGAGSTKGFAHIGVLQVLEEHHIPIDLIAGSSIGAIVASIYAAGTDLHLLEKFVLQMNIRDYLDIGKLGAGGLKQLSGLTEAYLLTQLERGFRTLDFYKQVSLEP